MTTQLDVISLAVRPGVLALVVLVAVLVFRHLFIEFLSDTRDKKKR